MKRDKQSQESPYELYTCVVCGNFFLRVYELTSNKKEYNGDLVK
jgi:hypothetical protein